MEGGLRKQEAQVKQLGAFRTLGWDTRGKRMCHRLTAGILVLTLAAQFGCASSGVDKRFALDLLPPSPGEAVQVAVTSGRFTPKLDINDTNLPSSFKEQLLFAALLPPLVIPLLVLGPFIVDIVDALQIGKESAIEGAKKIAEQKAALYEMVAGLPIQDDLRNRVVAVSLAYTPNTFRGLADQGPSAPGKQPDYRLLSQEGTQAVLEVVVESVALEGMQDISERVFRLMMTVSRRLVRTVDNAEILANTHTHYGKSWQSMEEWVGDPEGFRNELNRVYAEIAERTVGELFPRTESN